MDIISYILSKKYTDKALEGAGALKGANCTIQSIEPINGGNRVTFEWTLNDGTVETDTMDVMNGVDGVDGDGIPTYDTMPSESDILAMTNGTVFHAINFYAVGDGGMSTGNPTGDGAGGYYMISTNAVKNSRRYTDGTTTKYLVAIDDKGWNNEYVNLARLGVRAMVGDYETLTTTNTFATMNSDIIDAIQFNDATSTGSTWYLPKGHFYFARPLDLSNFQRHLVGEQAPYAFKEIMRAYSSSYARRKYSLGTTLFFPFLENGQAGVISENGNVKNITIVGGFGDNYDFDINRTSDVVLNHPDQVVTEVIKQVNGADYKTIGLKKTGGGFIENVHVMGFYTGIKTQASSVYLTNLFTRKCHFGYDIAHDAKCSNLYGWNIHTGIRVGGALISVNQMRVDSCVNLIQAINTVTGCVFTDCDGDWCTDSLVQIGDGTTWSWLQNCTFLGLRGRSNTLKYYDNTTETAPKGSEMTTSNSDGYGMFRVAARGGMKDNYIQCHVNRAKCFDVSDSNTLAKYVLPSILMTFSANTQGYNHNQFVINDSAVEDSTQYVRDLVQTSTTSPLIYRIDTTFGTYQIKQSTCTKVGGSDVSVTQTLSSGTKIAEIDIDGTTTNLYAPSGGSGSSTLSELTDVNLSSPTNEQVLTYDSSTSKWVNAIAKKEIVQIAEEDIPESPNIEDKIYEAHGEPETESYILEFPPATATIKEIENYFDSFMPIPSYISTLNWGVTFEPYTKTTFIKDGVTAVLEYIEYYDNTNNYKLYYYTDDVADVMTVQPATQLAVQNTTTYVEYFLGDSVSQTMCRISDDKAIRDLINSLKLGNLLDVDLVVPLQDNDVLAYDSATNRWKNSSAFATKSEVQAKQDVVQYSELPTPSASLEGKVLQYIGDGTPSKAVVTVIDDGGNKSSTTTGILSYLQNKNIPLNIGVNTYQIGSSNKYYTLAELQALEEQGSEIIMRGGTDSSFSTDAATVEAFTQDAEAVKTYAETNGFNTKLRIYPQGIRVYGGTDVDEKIGVLNDLGVEMAFNLECNVEMYDMSHSHPGYEEWYDYANGHDAGLGIANVAPFVTMPNGYGKNLMLNRAEMTHAKLTDEQRVADINTMIQAHRYVVLFGHSYQSEWTTAGDDGKTTTELFESFIDDLTETYGDEILWLTPTQAWNYFNSLPKTGHFYKCVSENNTYTWQEIPSVSEVTVTPTLSTGTKIGSISVDGNETDLFAPSGSGGATSLSGLSDVQLDQSVGDWETLRYDSSIGKWLNAPISPITETPQSTEITLEPNRFYRFSVVTELDISLNINNFWSFVQEFHFLFVSGSTPTELSLPSNIVTPDDFSIEANKIYEISIMDGLLLYNSWTMPEQEEPEQN